MRFRSGSSERTSFTTTCPFVDSQNIFHCIIRLPCYSHRLITNRRRFILIPYLHNVLCVCLWYSGNLFIDKCNQIEYYINIRNIKKLLVWFCNQYSSSGSWRYFLKKNILLNNVGPIEIWQRFSTRFLKDSIDI